MPVEAPLEELRHGEDIGSQVERDENPAENEQDETGQPFKVPHGQPGGRPGTR